MILGNGDIAAALREGGFEFDDKTYFAMGVSNSQETRESEYQRELKWLGLQHPSYHLVYFSSLCIYYLDTRYARHKREMEAYIKRTFDTYCIMRLGNIDWGTNPHTLINYLRAHPDAELRDEWRYIVDKDEFFHRVKLIPAFSCEMNVPGLRMTVKDIYRRHVERIAA